MPQARFFTSAIIIATAFISSSPTLAAGKYHFWSAPKNVSMCETGSTVVALPLNPRAVGGHESMGVKFVTAVGRNLSRAIRSKSYNLPAFKAEFVSAARSGAYAKLGPKGRTGGSPVFVSSAILTSAAHVVSLLDQRKAWTLEERKIVINWGNRIDKNQNHKYQYATLDSLAAIAAARMSWGAATNQTKIFNKGMRDFQKLMKRISKNGLFEKNMRDNNEIFGPILIAAEAAMNSGKNVYGKKYGKFTLHDAVRIHADKTLAAGAKKIAVAEDEARSYFRPSGFAAHVAWIPIYLSRYPNTAAAKSVRNLKSAVSKVKRGRFHGNTVAGPSECLWGKA